MDPLFHHHRRRHHHHYSRYNQRLTLATVTALAFLLFASTKAATGINTSRQLSDGVRKERGEAKRGDESELLERILSRRKLSGLGSSPPTCRSKCGRCSPCKPVHVPIQPGFSIPLEYYPEAWRCNCGNKLFMP